MMSGSSVMLCTGCHAVCIPPSWPEAMSTCTPAFLQRAAVRTPGNTCIQIMPCSLTKVAQGIGSPAVVTRTRKRRFISGSASRSSLMACMTFMALALTSAETMTFAPKIPSDSLVSSNTRVNIFLKMVTSSSVVSACACLQKSSKTMGLVSRDVVANVLHRPRQPALAAAMHRLVTGYGPMPACMMGYLSPTSSVSLVLIMMFFSFQTLCVTGNVPECYLSDYDYYINSAHRIPEHRLRK